MSNDYDDMHSSNQKIINLFFPFPLNFVKLYVLLDFLFSYFSFYLPS